MIIQISGLSVERHIYWPVKIETTAHGISNIMTTSAFDCQPRQLPTTDTTAHHWDLAFPYCSGKNGLPPQVTSLWTLSSF